MQLNWSQERDASGFLYARRGQGGHDRGISRRAPATRAMRTILLKKGSLTAWARTAVNWDARRGGELADGADRWARERNELQSASASERSPGGSHGDSACGAGSGIGLAARRER
jgi:hypothetical protein